MHVAHEWKKIECRSIIGNKKFFATDVTKVYQINNETFNEDAEVESNHKEADTRMFIHAKKMFMKFLVGFHNFTGCDAISAFSGTGKLSH